MQRVIALGSSLPIAAATDRSAAGAAVIGEALAHNPDIVIVDYPHANVLMPQHINTTVIVFTHNIEAEIFERHAKRARGLWRIVWADQSRKMARLEQSCLARCDSVIAVSVRDRDMLAKRYHLRSVEAIDTGVDVDFFAVSPPESIPNSDSGTIVFTATMDWPANVDGIHFLLDQVFPILLKSRPKIQAIIIGRDPPIALSNKIKERGLDVTLTGFVEDIRPWVARANVYVIPLFVGSGTRIKAFEAMAMGKPVVSTSLGVEGLDVTDGENFIRADDAAAFAGAILELLNDAPMRARIAGAARHLVEQRFSWSRVARQFEAICERTLDKRRRCRLDIEPKQP